MVTAPTPVSSPSDPKATRARISWISTILVSAGLPGVGSILYYITSTFRSMYDGMGVNLPWITSFVVLNYRWFYPCLFGSAVLVLIAKQFYLRSEGGRMAVTTGAAALFVLLFWGVILALYAPLIHLRGQLR